MASTKIKLSRPFSVFAGMPPIAEIEILEPSGRIYAKLGEPRVMVFNATGSGYWVEQPEVIRAYLEELIKHESDQALGGVAVLSQMSLEDAKAAKDALLDFFTAAEAKLIERRRTPSSSASAA